MSDILEWAATIGLLLISVLLLLLAGEPSRGKTIAVAKWFWRNLASFLQKHREPLEIVWTLVSWVGIFVWAIVYWWVVSTLIVAVLGIAVYSLVWLFSSAENRIPFEDMLRMLRIGGIFLICVLLLLFVTEQGRSGVMTMMERFWRNLSNFSIVAAARWFWRELKDLLTLTFGCATLIIGFLLIGSICMLLVYGLLWVIIAVVREVR